MLFQKGIPDGQKGMPNGQKGMPDVDVTLHMHMLYHNPYLMR